MSQADLAAALGRATAPDDCYAALMELARAEVGLRLFTVMIADMEAGLVRRAFTSHPQDYPASGTKPIRLNAWFETMQRGETFVAADVRDHPDQFPDADTIEALGCGSVVNVPVHSGGALIGAVNLLDTRGTYRPEEAGRLTSSLALPALAALLAAQRLG
ncbi:GAF domain-containing protein [Wenxinia saemankumensis]|uniref:GAF domain-containing protein n=1 Tax=Wenxinia saemankumensis TaxID=1447782 RepID=A0A1M6FMI2_9RHOB|nr:GAF domain-containing protein [Wenxinia saemankumensis]SHI98896.1 GAF domain-containing protein [Wenxinia saemankumensis]